MLNKVSCAIGMTLQLKKQQLYDLVHDLDQKLLPLENKNDYIGKGLTKDGSKISIKEFQQKMCSNLQQYKSKFLELETQIDIFSMRLRQLRLPDYLQQNETFLGKYYITDVIPYTQIYAEKLMSQPSVFINNTQKQKGNSKAKNTAFQQNQYLSSNIEHIAIELVPSLVTQSRDHLKVLMANKAESQGILKETLYEKISDPLTDDSLQMHFMYLFNLNYAYRAKTEAIFEDRTQYFFDFYVTNDEFFAQYFLY